MSASIKLISPTKGEANVYYHACYHNVLCRCRGIFFSDWFQHSPSCRKICLSIYWICTVSLCHYILPHTLLVVDIIDNEAICSFRVRQATCQRLR